jgi:hypothetical protein
LLEIPYVYSLCLHDLHDDTVHVAEMRVTVAGPAWRGARRADVTARATHAAIAGPWNTTHSSFRHRWTKCFSLTLLLTAVHILWIRVERCGLTRNTHIYFSVLLLCDLKFLVGLSVRTLNAYMCSDLECTSFVSSFHVPCWP